jgi:hypothetical protein
MIVPVNSFLVVAPERVLAGIVPGATIEAVFGVVHAQQRSAIERMRMNVEYVRQCFFPSAWTDQSLIDFTDRELPWIAHHRSSRSILIEVL